MPISPATQSKHHRPLARQQSSPSLAVGLPPPLPETDPLSPSRSFTSLRTARLQHRVHRGDVSSSAASSSDSGDDSDTFDQITPARSVTTMAGETTPKRKVIGAMESSSVGRPKAAAKRDNLQARLQAAAKLKQSRSFGDGLNAAPPVPSLPSLSASASSSSSRVKATSDDPFEISPQSKNDKVIVCVRIKPTTSPFATTAYEITPTSLSLSNYHPNVQKRGGKSGREEEYTYTFDKLLRYPATTPDLYSSKVAPLVEKAMNGFNSTIFAYGQTGSGKSFTMTGTQDELGIIPCAVDGVFDAINAEPDRAFLLRVSYIEIYNETLRDLLNFKKGPLRDDEKPVIHTSKGKVYVEPLVEEVVSSPQDVVDLLERGNTIRKVGATDWNERSSRSHSVFTIVVESRPRDGDSDDDVRLSRLNLIDLAGSEKAVSDAERRGEGRHINRSLLALREVINKLTDKKRAHVPYRDSKLTHLLENALGGDSNICVICTMSAEEEHCSETLETLKFAGRCSQVETQAKKNVLLSNDRALIRAKDREIEELKRHIKSLAEGSTVMEPSQESVDQMADLADSVAAMETRKTKLTVQLAKLNGEILTSEILPRSGSIMPITPKPKRRRISEFHMMGKGTPNKVAVADRRAVSSMIRVNEESVPEAASEAPVDPFKTFDNDRTIASLRKALSSKEEELVSANGELSTALARLTQLAEREAEVAALQQRLESLIAERDGLMSSSKGAVDQHDLAMRDMHIQLELTRAEFVQSVNDKSSKIDELETAILELRKSREDLVIEDQQRYDELKAQLDTAMKQVAEANAEAERARSGLEGQLAKTKAELDSVLQQHAEARKAIEDGHGRSRELEDTLSSTRAELDQSKSAHSALGEHLAKAHSERDAAEKSRQEARDDLDRFQQAAMANEAQQVTELREELGKLRSTTDEAAAASEKELDALRAQLDEAKSNSETLGNDLASAKQEAANAGAEFEEERKKVQEIVTARDALQVQLQEANSRESSLADELTKAKAELDQIKASLEKELEEERGRSEDLRRQHQERDERESGLKKDVESRDSRVRELEEQHARSSQTDDERTKELEAERAKSADLLRQLEERDGREADLKKDVQDRDYKVRELEEQLAKAIEEHETRVKELESSHATAVEGHGTRLKELEDVHAKTVEEREGRIRDLEQQHGSDAEERDAKIQGLERSLAEAVESHQARFKELEEQHMKDVAERDSRIQDLQNAEQSRDAQIEERDGRIRSLEEQHRKDVDSRDAKIRQLEEGHGSIVEGHAAALRGLQASHDEAVGAHHAKLTSLKDDHRKATATVETHATRIKELESLNEGHLASSTELKTTVEKLTAEVAQHRESAEKHSKSAADAQDKLKAEAVLRRAAEERLEALEKSHAQQSIESSALGVDNAALRQSLDAAHSELEQARRDMSSSTDRATELAKEIAVLNARPSQSARSSSDPSVPSDAVMDTLRDTKSRTAASDSHTSQSPAAKLQTKESEEIARLEKIVEAQKIMIDDQREKIKFWHKELEQQREIVRALTMEQGAAGGSPGPRGHHKAKSVSTMESPRSSSHAGSATTTATVKKGLPSTFAAFNLALPASPTPLPMHPSQFDNTTARKGRRVTIEHDIGRLTESSAVMKARAKFDNVEDFPSSPEKTPMKHKRTGSAIPGSVPKQRRP